MSPLGGIYGDYSSPFLCPFLIGTNFFPHTCLPPILIIKVAASYYIASPISPCYFLVQDIVINNEVCYPVVTRQATSYV